MKWNSPGFGLIAALALSLCGCAGLSQVALESAAADMVSEAIQAPPPPSVTADRGRVVFPGDQALASASLAYEGLVALIAVGISDGLVAGDDALLLQNLNREALMALERGEAAGTDAERARHAARAWSAINVMDALPILERIRRHVYQPQTAAPAAQPLAQPFII